MLTHGPAASKARVASPSRVLYSCQIAFVTVVCLHWYVLEYAACLLCLTVAAVAIHLMQAHGPSFDTQPIHVEFLLHKAILTGVSFLGYLTRLISNSTLKMCIFWGIMPCSPLKVNRRFRGTCHFQLQDRRISKARNHHEAGSKHSSCLAYSSTMKMEPICSSESSVDFNGLHGVISQKIELFITTALRT
jgi:hypothetical protein